MNREHALIRAGNTGQLDIILCLLNEGVDINSEDDYGYTALFLASHNNQIETVELLLQKGANSAVKDKNNKLFDNQEVMDILKAIGYDPSFKEPLDNLRVGKIILLSDADPDGYHINLLLFDSYW